MVDFESAMTMTASGKTGHIAGADTAGTADGVGAGNGSGLAAQSSSAGDVVSPMHHPQQV